MLEEVLALCQSEMNSTDLKLADSVLDKLAKSELGPVKRAGISVAAALEAFRQAEGSRIVVPPTPGPGWYAQLQKRLTDTGITAADCATIAKVAAAKWHGYIKAESLIRQAEALLQEAQLPLPQMGAPNKRRVGLPELEDL